MSEINTHRSVLMKEVLQALNIQASGVYFDGTFGRGGHAGEILKRLGPSGKLLAMDKDPEAIRSANEKFANDKRFTIVQGSFAMMADVIKRVGLTGQVNGVLLDLGVSSPQLDNADRGFSFMKQGPLDMRMDTTQGLSATEWLAQAEEDEISTVIRDYGEEKFHYRIAKAIVEQRQSSVLMTTLDLANLIEKVIPKKGREKGKHPATRTFQAIRIFINRELEDLQTGLQSAVEALALHGRMAVISFHSLEDRIVKRFLRKKVQGKQLPPDLPVQYEDTGAELKLISKAIRPSKEEVEENIRSRSATLRIAEKIIE